MKHIAALITCHNRKSKTLSCLEALFKNMLPVDFNLEVFLVDDGSEDGTEDAVRERYPHVNIIKGNGNLYWCGGMRVAFGVAMKRKFDEYLLLNDDTKLHPQSISILLEAASQARDVTGSPSIIVGSVIDPSSGQLSYGGRNSRGWMQPLYFDLVPPQEVPIACDTANANCLLIPSRIADEIGNLDSVFAHGKADYDYGLRAKRRGYRTFVASSIVGECSTNPPEDSDRFGRMTIVQKWKYLSSPKQFPLYEWFVFTWRHAGPLWFIHWLRPYRRLFF